MLNNGYEQIVSQELRNSLNDKICVIVPPRVIAIASASVSTASLISIFALRNHYCPMMALRGEP